VCVCVCVCVCASLCVQKLREAEKDFYVRGLVHSMQGAKKLQSKKLNPKSKPQFLNPNLRVWGLVHSIQGAKQLHSNTTSA